MEAGLLGLGTNVLPPLPRHAGDRNRTSPFAFTGNKFEFRAVGSSQSISFPITVLNTIVADAVQGLTAELKARLDSGAELAAAVGELVRETYSKHKRIVFNGDGYSDEWHEEAEHARGLLNLRTSIDAFPQLTSAKNAELFGRFGVLSERELAARQEVLYDQYFKTVNIEGETTEYVARTMILPAAVAYLAELHQAGGSRAVQATTGEIEVAADALYDALQALGTQNAALGGEEVHEKAHHVAAQVLPAMTAVRQAADRLEKVVAERHWPLPTYRQMLFVK